MYKTLVAGLTALSFTITPAPAAAEISEREVGQLVFGLLVAGIIGKAISDHNRRDTARQTPAERPRQIAPPRQHQQNRNNPIMRTQQPLPATCLRQHETQNGVQRVFGQRCLERRYDHVQALPQQCHVRLRTFNGPRQGFTPRCLRDFGYRTDRRNH